MDALEQLTFVSADRAPLPIDERVDEDLLVNQFETTRGEWRKFLEGAKLAQNDDWSSKLAGWPSDADNWPASWMTRDEARAFAAQRDMRLPTVVEWLLIAAGPQGRLFPWGDTRFDSVADTLDFGLMRPVAVGTFESGRTPEGAYDVLGNVWEWCSDVSPKVAIERGDACAFGGSYLSFARPIYNPADGKFFVLALDSASRSDDVGVRLVANARDYLASHAPRWTVTPRNRERLLRVGRRFGVAAIPLLDELARRDGAPSALAVLLEGARR